VVLCPGFKTEVHKSLVISITAELGFALLVRREKVYGTRSSSYTILVKVSRHNKEGLYCSKKLIH